MNEDFRRLNADRNNTPAAFTGVASDYGFEFRLACQDPNGNTTNGVLRRQTNKNTFQYISSGNGPNENAMGIKMTSTSGEDPWPTDRYLNIWVADFDDGTLGYSTFPADFAINPNVDGVVIETTSMGRTDNVTVPFDKGRTATHEIGHWLNLRHIWGDANCGDDFVGDTPQQQTQNLQCPGFPHASPCSGNGTNGDMFMNYMDYTDDACMNIYTNGQRLRGRAIFAAGGPRTAFLDNYFRIQQPTSTINCNGNILLTNPTCVAVTWSVTSGPATILSGQGTNAVQIQGSGTGTAHLVANGGNYTNEIDFNISSSATEPITNIDEVKINNGCVTETSTYTAIGGTGATNYKWYYRQLPSGIFSLRKNSSDNFYALTQSNKVRNCSNYEIKVEASNSCPSNPVIKTIQSAVCPCNNIFTIAPNPATSSISISSTSASSRSSISNNATIDKVSVYDQQGNLRKYQLTKTAKLVKIDISDLANGIYVIEIQGGNYLEKQKFIIQK